MCLKKMNLLLANRAWGNLLENVSSVVTAPYVIQCLPALHQRVLATLWELFTTLRSMSQEYMVEQAHTQYLMHVWWFINIKIPSYLEWWLFVRRRELLPLLVPCSKSIAPFSGLLPGPQHPLFPLSVHTCEHLPSPMTYKYPNLLLLGTRSLFHFPKLPTQSEE